MRIPPGLLPAAVLLCTLGAARAADADTDDTPHRIYGKPSGVEGLVIPNGWLQEERLDLAPVYPELTALDIALWDYYDTIAFVPVTALQGFERSEGGCRIFAGLHPGVSGGDVDPAADDGPADCEEEIDDDAAAEGYTLRCFRNPAKELHCQLIGDVAIPLEFSCIHDPTPLPIATYFGVPEEIADRDDVFMYYYLQFPDENEGDIPAPDTAAILAEFKALTGEGSMQWFSGMIAVVVYPTDDSGFTWVGVLSTELLRYYLFARMGLWP